MQRILNYLIIAVTAVGMAGCGRGGSDMTDPEELPAEQEQQFLEAQRTEAQREAAAHRRERAAEKNQE